MNAEADDFLSAVRQVIQSALDAHGVPRAEGLQTADRACAALCEVWGGSAQWLPQIDRDGRDRLIVQARLGGASIEAISRITHTSSITVRRVIRRQSAGLGRDDWVL